MKQTWIQRRWKNLPDTIRRSVVFLGGMLLVTIAPFVGALPGPGGVIIFLSGIAVLATEFDWAENLKEVIMKKAPEEVKRRWKPTPRWQIIFDFTTVGLLAAAVTFYLHQTYLPVVSLTTAAIAITAFNRSRLERLKARLKRKR
jgi:hypothetical protein